MKMAGYDHETSYFTVWRMSVKSFICRLMVVASSSIKYWKILRHHEAMPQIRPMTLRCIISSSRPNGDAAVDVRLRRQSIRFALFHAAANEWSRLANAKMPVRHLCSDAASVLVVKMWIPVASCRLCDVVGAVLLSHRELQLASRGVASPLSFMWTGDP